MKPRYLLSFAAAAALATTARAQSPGDPPKDAPPPPPPAAAPHKDGGEHHRERGMMQPAQMLEHAKQHIEELRKAGKNEEADKIEQHIKAMQEHMAQMHHDGAAPGANGMQQHQHDGATHPGGPQQKGTGLSPERAGHLKEAIKQLRLAGLDPIAEHLEHGPGPFGSMQHGQHGGPQGFSHRGGGSEHHFGGSSERHGPPWADASGRGQHHGFSQRGGEGEHHGFRHHGPPWADASEHGRHHHRGSHGRGGKGGHHQHHGQRGGEGEHHGFHMRGGEGGSHHHGFSQRGGEGEHHAFGQSSGGNMQIERLTRQVEELSRIVAGMAHARMQQPQGNRGERHEGGPQAQGREHHEGQPQAGEHHERRPQGDRPPAKRPDGEHPAPAPQAKPEKKADQSSIEEIRPAIIPTSPKSELAQLSVQ